MLNKAPISDATAAHILDRLGESELGDIATSAAEESKLYARYTAALWNAIRSTAPRLAAHIAEICGESPDRRRELARSWSQPTHLLASSLLKRLHKADATS